jgi:hypothetical protein
MLSREFNSKVSTNCYVSGPAVQGFELHYDRHDVYVVQAQGRKRWFIYEATSLKFPMDKQRRPTNERPTGDPYLECELGEGDVLYLPRGHWHYVVAQTPSMHLSIGVQPRTGIDLLQWLTDRLMTGDEFLRQDFPLVDTAALGGLRDDGALEAHIERFRQHLHKIIDGYLLGALVQYCMGSVPAKRSYRFPDAYAMPEQITPLTTLVLNPTQKALLDYHEEQQLTVVKLRGHQFRFTGRRSRTPGASNPTSRGTFLVGAPAPAGARGRSQLRMARAQSSNDLERRSPPARRLGRTRPPANVR